MSNPDSQELSVRSDDTSQLQSPIATAKKQPKQRTPKLRELMSNVDIGTAADIYFTVDGVIEDLGFWAANIYNIILDVRFSTPYYLLPETQQHDPTVIFEDFIYGFGRFFPRQVNYIFNFDGSQDDNDTAFFLRIIWAGFRVGILINFCTFFMPINIMQTMVRALIIKYVFLTDQPIMSSITRCYWR